MSRTNQLLLLIFIPTFISVVYLHLQVLLSGGSTIPTIRVSFDPAPVIVNLNRDLSANLEVGDRILRLAGETSENISPFNFKLKIATLLSNQQRIELQIDRDGVLETGYLIRRDQPFKWSMLPMTIGFAVVAIMVLWRAPTSPNARLFFLGFVSVAIFQMSIERGSELQIAIGMFMFVAFGMLGICCILLWIIGFPRSFKEEEHWRFPIWIAPLAAFLWMSPRISYYLMGPLPVESYDIQTASLNVGFFLLAITVLSWNYLHLDQANRRRTKWVVLGAYIGLTPNLFVEASKTWLEPEVFDLLNSFTNMFHLAIPFCIWIAITRYNLYDVNQVFSGAITYTILVVVIALGIEAVLEPIAGMVAENAGVSAAVGQMLFVASIAALALPIQSYLRPAIDRTFTGKPRKFSDTMTELMRALSDQESIEAEELAVVAVNQASLELDTESSLLVLLEDEEWRVHYRSGTEVISKTSLQKLGSEAASYYEPWLIDENSEWFHPIKARLIVPLRNNTGCFGYLFFGEKKSKDIYTQTECSLIGAMAALLATRLSRTTVTDRS